MSVNSAYDAAPWITPLVAFLVYLTSSYPDTKIFGICFGHQILAHALGGECVKNDRGWEIGVMDVTLTDIGKEIMGTDILVSTRALVWDTYITISPHAVILSAQKAYPIYSQRPR